MLTKQIWKQETNGLLGESLWTPVFPCIWKANIFSFDLPISNTQLSIIHPQVWIVLLICNTFDVAPMVIWQLKVK